MSVISIRHWFDQVYWHADHPPAFAEVSAIIHQDSDAWVEFIASYPLYQIWTQESIQALADYVVRQQSQCIVEVGAGNGYLSHWLRPLLPGTTIIPTDNYSWRSLISQQLPDEPVKQHDVIDALRIYHPDTVLSSWMPYGADWTPAFRQSGATTYVLIGEGLGGCVGSDESWQIAEGWQSQRIPGFAEYSLCRTDYLSPYADSPRIRQQSLAMAFEKVGHG